MIPATTYSPGKAMIQFARRFIEALAADDWHAALAPLDSTGTRWSKRRLAAELRTAMRGRPVCTADGITRSASPRLELREGGGGRLWHRLPADGKWTDAEVEFDFVRKPGTAYLKVYLIAIHG